MNERTKTGLEILQAAILLGILGDVMLRATPWGLNVLLFIGALVAAMLMFARRRKGELWTTENLLLHGALIVFAACFAWRDSIALQTFNVLIMLAILSILMLPAVNIQTHLAGFWQYVLGAVLAGFNAAFAPLSLILQDVEWKTIPQTGLTKNLTAILRGLAIATPILLIFGALFMAADAVFEGIVKNTFKISPEIVFSHIFLFGFLTWICAGYLRGAIVGSPLMDLQPLVETPAINSPPPSVVNNETETTAPETSKPAATSTVHSIGSYFRLGAIEIGIILGLINLLFLGFVVIQLKYFFGGMDLVQSTENFKLAEYARRGFGELVTVAALVLPILLIANWLIRKENALTQNLFRVLASAQIVLLFVIMYSAAQRMLLYTGELGYGMTEWRLYPLAFMIWLAVVFVLFALTALRGQTQRFAWGALWSAMLVVFGLHVLNPDNFIVRHNHKLMQQGRTFDTRYMSRLSDDAVSAMVETMPEMTFEQQCIVKNEYKKRWFNQEAKDFRQWNFARWNAQNALAQIEDFDTRTCPASTRSYHRDYDNF